MQMITVMAGILALLGTIGIHYIFSLIAGNLFSNSVLSVFLCAVFFLLWKKTAEQIEETREAGERRRRLLYAGGLAYFFALTMVTGYQLKAQGFTAYGVTGKLKILAWAFCLSAAVFPAAYALFSKLSDISLHAEKGLRRINAGGREWGSKKLFFICWGIIFLCWIPVFLAYYPAVMSYDFHRQSREASFGPPYFNSHHPLAHTFLIWVFFQVGKFFGSLETGMAFYSIFQMLLLSAATAWSCVTIYRLCGKKAVLIAAALFFAIFPYHSVLAVSVTKDVIFAALFLFFLLLLTERVYFRDRHNKNLLDLAIFLEGCLMLLFRNNAIYALAVFSVFFVLMTAGKERMRVLLLCILIIAAGKASLEGLQAALGGLGRGSDVEKYSVVIQQFARVGFYHDENLDPETAELINTYVPRERWSSYNPPIADTVKVMVPFENWEKDMGAMWRAWAKTGLQYPNEYLDAFCCLTSGYWFLDDVTWAENLGYGLEERKGALFTFNSTVSDILPEGIDHESKFPWLESRLEELVSNNCFYRWPVISNLFKPAFYCWLLGICILACLYLKKKKALLVALLPLLYLGTLLLGPVVIVRYMYPVLISVPVLFALLFYRDSEG